LIYTEGGRGAGERYCVIVFLGVGKKRKKEGAKENHRRKKRLSALEMNLAGNVGKPRGRKTTPIGDANEHKGRRGRGQTERT